MVVYLVQAFLKKKRHWLMTYRTQAERAAILSANGGSEDDGLVRQGKLDKRGARVGDAWNARWVKLAPELLSYYYYDEPTQAQGAIIDRIPIYEVERVITEQEYAAAQTLDDDERLDDTAVLEGAGETQEKGGRVSRDGPRLRHTSSRRDLAAQLSETAFLILTRENGDKEGRMYRFQAATTSEMSDWMDAIKQTKDNFKLVPVSRLEKLRLAVGKFYASDPVQLLIAVIIVINFLCNAVEAELLPTEGSKEDHVLETLDKIFVALFTIELGVNMFANLWTRFVSDGWNYFDGFVVIISLVAILAQDNPGLNVLRMVRAFRVFRLFRRLKSLGKIIRAINQSLPAVGNAFFLVLLVTAIYAIMGTSFFRLQFPEYYSSFSVSMYTMFQIMTFDDSGGLTLDIMAGQKNASDKFLVVVFTLSFQLIVGFILCNIVMAVLLDKFTEASMQSKADEAAAQRALQMRLESTVLDPVFEQLSRVETEEMLTCRIQELFRFIDEDGSEMIDFPEMRSGFKRMDTDPAIDFKLEDYNAQIVDRGLAMTNRQLGPTHFTNFINVGLKEYCQKQISRAAGEVKPDEKLTAILRSLQQTAFTTSSSEQMVQTLTNKVSSMRSNIDAMRRKVAKLKQKTRSAEFKSTDQMPRHSTPLQQSVCPVPNLLAVTPGAGPPRGPQTKNGIRRSHGTLGSKDSLGTSTLVLSPMMSPMMMAPDTHPGLMHTGSVTATPKSLLGSAPSSKKHDFQGPGGRVDVMDIRGLNARVDAMQARLVYTIQQAKLARQKTRSAATGRRGQEQEGGNPSDSDASSASPKDVTFEDSPASASASASKPETASDSTLANSKSIPS